MIMKENPTNAEASPSFGSLDATARAGTTNESQIFKKPLPKLTEVSQEPIECAKLNDSFSKDAVIDSNQPENCTTNDENQTKVGESSKPDASCSDSSDDPQPMEASAPSISCRSDTSLLKQVLLKNTFTGSDTTQTQKNMEIFTEDTGPKWYNVHGPIVTQRLNSRNLPDAFNYLPVHGRPNPNESIEEFHDRKIREFIGCDFNDEEYRKLSEICSPDHLRTGKELVMPSNIPMLSYHAADLEAQAAHSVKHESTKLCVIKKHKLRLAKDETRNFTKKLKYRGMRILPLCQQKLDMAPLHPNPFEELLEPGSDLLFHIRIYRPFLYNMNQKVLSGALAPCRHSVLSRDAVLSGRCAVRSVRDRCVCANDGDSRHDVSNRPAAQPTNAHAATAKELFPSGFLFINNVFYVDNRPGCKDLSEPIREWAFKRGMGKFECRSMDCALQDIPLRLGHPEVYVHQGNCEHLFTISEVRLVSAADPLNASHYPCHTALSQNQSVYCTTCAEFCAKWIVVGSKRVPFDPAFFCDTCLKLYLYVDGEKIEDFKLYAYRGNEMNTSKPPS